MPPSVPLSKRRIAEEALHLIDQDGFDSLTVRSLAGRLGVQSPSLYNHVGSKEEILMSVSGLLGERIDVDTLADPDLATALTGFARSYRQAFGGHPEVTALLARRPVTDPIALELYETAVHHLTGHGLPPERAYLTLGVIETVVLGSVMLTFSAGLQAPSVEYAPLLARTVAGMDLEWAEAEIFELSLAGAVRALTAQDPT